MILTDIRPRRRRLSQLYIDGEAAVQVDTETLARSGLAVGDELDDEALHALLEASAEHRAHEKALADKIARAEFDREAAQRAADRMEELGLIDDEDYARRLAQSLFGGKHFGARRVKQELRRKGIADDVIEAVLAEFSTDRDETEENIRAILERKYPGAWTDEKVRRRAVAALQRYGYGFEEIFSVLNAEGPEE
mgnify:CR=1 FL=1